MNLCEYISKKVGEMFIVCGVLYAIDSVTERNTKIRLALDLYRGVVLDDVNLSFTNPFKNTTMALYNPETKVFYIAYISIANNISMKINKKNYVRNNWQQKNRIT